MKIELEKQEHNMVKMNIEIPAKEAIDAYNRASQRIAQNVNIAGFRRGKAPRNVVEQNVGIDRIKYEALEGMLPRVFQQVIKENELDVISQPEVNSYDFNIGSDLKIIAQVELRPEVILGDYKGLEVEVEGYEILEDAYQKALDNLVNQAVTYELVVDRPACETDMVKFDFDGYSNGEKIKNGDGQNYTLDLSNSNFIPGFAEKLVGHSINEEFDISVNFPDTYHEAKLAGQPATFKIKIHEIKQKNVPEVNDELAKKVGFESMVELEADIKSYLEKNKANIDSKNAEVALFDKIISGVKVDIQESMIAREEELLMNEYKQKLTGQGFTFEQAVEAQGMDEITKTIKEDATKRIKNSLVIDKLAKEEGIKIETVDMTDKIQEIQSSYGMDKTAVMQQMAQNPNLLNSLSQQIISEKVTKFLKDNNTIKFVEAKPEKKTKAKKAKKDEE